MKSNPPPKLPLLFTAGKRVPSLFPVMGEEKREREIKCMVVFLLTVLDHQSHHCFTD